MNLRAKGLLLVVLCFTAPLAFCLSSAAQHAAQRAGAPLLTLASIPPRPADALSGTDFAKTTAAMTGPQRQQAAIAEILKGNVPSFVRLQVPVALSGQLPSGETTTAVVWVSPDYLAIGSDDDFLRMPLTLPSATKVARTFQCVLPTARIVDAVWQQADVHLTPAPLPPGPRMRSSEYYLRHRSLIEGQRGDLPPETLVAGDKKDVVLTPRLFKKRDRIAIYGWHRNNGQPIQPLSTVHGARYADYSHGIRLVSDQVLINGERRSIFDVLADPSLAPLLNAEGAFDARGLMQPM